MTLKDLNIGETAVVGTVGGEGALRSATNAFSRVEFAQKKHRTLSGENMWCSGSNHYYFTVW